MNEWPGVRRVEVRCCCRPDTLLGWLPVRDDQVWEGSRVRFEVKPATVEYHASEHGPVDVVRHARQVVTLPIAWWSSGILFDGHLALKSEETPLETLRQIRGFVEARR